MQNKKTLVWLTNSFRRDSRLTANLSGDVSFVYYSPYYFAGHRERDILRKTSNVNLQLFWGSIDQFNEDVSNALETSSTPLHIFKESDPITHINRIIKEFEYTDIIIDMPKFAWWKELNLAELTITPSVIDSNLVDPGCIKRTTKSRWMSHTRNFEKPHLINRDINLIDIPLPTCTYPKGIQLDTERIIQKAQSKIMRYFETRNRADGQTNLSIPLQIGVIDLHNVFYRFAEIFRQHDADFTKNESSWAGMLRQFSFGELTIMQSRRLGLNLGDSIDSWVRGCINEKSYDNFIAHRNPKSTLTFENILNANTGHKNLDRILKWSYTRRTMPNRARMYIAGKIFYEAPDGPTALKWIIDLFDQRFLDGQSPNNYSQSCGAMYLQYGKVMLLNEGRVMDLLRLEETKPLCYITEFKK